MEWKEEQRWIRKVGGEDLRKEKEYGNSRGRRFTEMERDEQRKEMDIILVGEGQGKVMANISKSKEKIFRRQ